MGKVIAVSTNKGGVLKTSIVTNLAGVMASEGKKVLIIDTDNQGDVSLSFGKNPDRYKATLYDVLVDGVSPKSTVEKIHKHIDVLPSNDDMAFLEFDVLSERESYPEPFLLMQKAMNGFEQKYDYVLVDTPPNLGLTQGNVLSYADEVLIPFQPEPYSMRSLVKVLNFMSDFRKRFNPQLKVLGVLPTMVDSRTTLHSDTLQKCRQFCEEREINIFDTIIPKTVRYANSVAYERLPATLTEKKHPLVQSYYELYREVKHG